jgi:sensor histidine kinase YesM
VRLRVAAAVAGLWVVVAIVWGAQTSLGAALQGRPQPLGPAVVDALHQSLPWIPGTLIVIALASRWPLTREDRRSRLAIHLAGVLLVAFATNLLVVLGYWIRYARVDSPLVLLREGARWGLVRLHVAALLYAVVAAFTQGVRSWQALRARELQMARLEAQLAEARLQVLNAQIRPHFLFNTLHAIGQLWRAGRADEAEAMLDHLGSLFQKVIASTTRTQVALSEELEMVRDYLAIEKVRFGDRMTSRVEAEPAALGCLVPPLILQPLVENAVKHAIAAAPGEVSLAARVADGRLVVEVTDEGPGEGAPERAAAGTGTGLANVRERLFGLYGARQSLETSRRAGAGTCVRLEVPAVAEGARG